jgi:hypothetical protein
MLSSTRLVSSMTPRVCNHVYGGFEKALARLACINDLKPNRSRVREEWNADDVVGVGCGYIFGLVALLSSVLLL